MRVTTNPCLDFPFVRSTSESAWLFIRIKQRGIMAEVKATGEYKAFENGNKMSCLELLAGSDKTLSIIAPGLYEDPER